MTYIIDAGKKKDMATGYEELCGFLEHFETWGVLLQSIVYDKKVFTLTTDKDIPVDQETHCGFTKGA